APARPNRSIASDTAQLSSRASLSTNSLLIPPSLFGTGAPWSGKRASASCGSCGAEAALRLDETGDAVESFAGAQVAEDERALAAHPPRVLVHFLERGADMGRQVDLVDDQEVRARDAGPALRRDLVAGGHVDHVDGHVGQFRREGRGKIVTT